VRLAKGPQGTEADGKVVTFRDVRAEPLSEAESWRIWITEFGARLV